MKGYNRDNKTQQIIALYIKENIGWLDKHILFIF